MRTFTVKGLSARIEQGILALSEGQAKARQHLLKPAGKGRFTLLAATDFKRGEVFGWNGEPTKALWQLLEEVPKKPSPGGSGD